MANIPFAPVRYHAVSMEFAAYLDERHVEMRILTNTGKTVTIVCDTDSIFSMQRHIEQMRRGCPEIADWNSLKSADREKNERSYEAAVWEGWPVSLRHAASPLRDAHLYETSKSLLGYHEVLP